MTATTAHLAAAAAHDLAARSNHNAADNDTFETNGAVDTAIRDAAEALAMTEHATKATADEGQETAEIACLAIEAMARDTMEEPIGSKPATDASKAIAAMHRALAAWINATT